ncbi:MAG: hypothetical protein LBR87_03790, partial [Synergistaceae bacterium]|nr:hypothetical protein [Synergistaceae bacterium]
MADVLATATLPAALGEWVQGWIKGRELIVSLVTAWHGSVELCILREGDAFRLAGRKAAGAFASAKEIFSGEGMNPFPDDCFLNIINPHPPSRGLGTSTMDVAGTYASAAAYAGAPLSEERLFSLCCGIDPGDGIMFKGLALVDYIKGELIERLPAPPAMSAVAVIPYRTLDTDDYMEGGLREASKECFREHERAYDTLKMGLERGDPSLAAMAATISAEASNKIMPREDWDVLRETCDLTGALGIAAAHAGTASALLYAEGNKFGADLAERMLKDSFSGHKVTVR